MIKLPVSVCIIAKNEEKYIGQCLESISEYGLETVVVDTGSADKTKAIAQKYTDKVFDFEWCDDFSRVRNYCADMASNDWILVIDCDEKIQTLDTDRLLILMKKFPHSIGKLTIKNITAGDNDYSTDEIMRFYNRQEYCFKAPVHEQLRRKSKVNNDEKMKCFNLPIEVIHYGYALSRDEMIKKQQRNLQLLYKMIETDPDNAYVYFQIGQSQAIMENYAQAIEAYEKSIQLDADTDKPYVQLLIISLSKCYSQIGDIRQALTLIEKYAPFFNTAAFTEMHAGLLWDSGQHLKSMVLYMKATLMPDADTLGEGLLRCYAHLIQGYYDAGDIKMAEMFKEKFETCKKEQEKQLL